MMICSTSSSVISSSISFSMAWKRNDEIVEPQAVTHPESVDGYEAFLQIIEQSECFFQFIKCQLR